MDVDLGSVYRGLRLMRHGNEAHWRFTLQWGGFWCHAWTPIWHAGRGPFISIGLGLFSIFRGY